MNKIELLLAHENGTWTTEVVDCPDTLDREDLESVQDWIIAELYSSSRYPGIAIITVYDTDPQYELIDEEEEEQEGTIIFKIEDFRFRERFWSPWEQHRARIGQRITILSVTTAEDDVPIFSIQFPDGETIEAWEEEVVHPSDITVNGNHPPGDEYL